MIQRWEYHNWQKRNEEANAKKKDGNCIKKYKESNAI